MSEEVEKLRTEVLDLMDKLAKQVSAEIMQVKSTQYSQTVRFEAFLRSLFSGESMTDYSLNTFLDSVDNITEWKKEIQKIQAIPEIIKRVQYALEANQRLKFPIYAEDLNFLPQIEAAGGTSSNIVELILTLPHTDRLAISLTKYHYHPAEKKKTKKSNGRT